MVTEAFFRKIIHFLRTSLFAFLFTTKLAVLVITSRWIFPIVISNYKSKTNFLAFGLIPNKLSKLVGYQILYKRTGLRETFDFWFSHSSISDIVTFGMKNLVYHNTKGCYRFLFELIVLSKVNICFILFVFV